MGHRGLRLLPQAGIVIALIAYFLSVTAVKSLRIAKRISATEMERNSEPRSNEIGCVAKASGRLGKV
jgi:hypothetical protein